MKNAIRKMTARTWLYVAILAVGVVPAVHLLAALSWDALTLREEPVYWYSDLPALNTRP